MGKLGLKGLIDDGFKDRLVRFIHNYYRGKNGTLPSQQGTLQLLYDPPGTLDNCLQHIVTAI